MFDLLAWFRRKPRAAPRSEFPRALGTKIEVAFSSAQRTWSEQADLVELLGEVLHKRGLGYVREDDALRLDSGLRLEPGALSVNPREPSGVQISSTVDVRHERLGPRRLFEYQHAIGEDTADGFRRGLDGWCEIDLPVLLDAIDDGERRCMQMEMRAMSREAPEREYPRRIVLGPVSHLVQHPSARQDGESHDFCACCLFTASAEAFRPLLESDGVFGLRLFASRNAQGRAEADCRVCGEDYAPGREALLRHVENWPQRGIEYRKQYAVIQPQTPGPPVRTDV